ncbi:MAG: hypothetical protein H6924_00325 [Alphaproteobacteria bacterium]|nr:hypothetical protein [Alphaproteobacteria bacterium]
MNSLLQRLDRQLRDAGREAGIVLIMLLAAAILCAPLALAVLLAWLACIWTQGAFGLRALGWFVGIAVLALLYRYIWNGCLHGAVRRAARALMSEP